LAVSDQRFLNLVLALAILPASIACADEAADELARQATDPTASLLAMNFIGDYTGGFYGPDAGDDDALDLTFRPAIPFTAFGKANILRITMPYRLSGRGEDGPGDIGIFNIVVTGESWGRWGAGLVASLFSNDAAPDDFAIGPAIGAVYNVSKKLNVGAFSQNVFAGDTAVSQLQPVIAYQLGQGWSLSAGDLQFAYDWKNDRWLSIPIGIQLGKVTRVGKQPVRWAVNPQYQLKDDPGLEEWSVALTFTLLLPGK
jgi:hypothetical protein